PATERAETDAPRLDPVVGAEPQPMVVDRDPARAALQHPPLGCEVERHDRDRLGLDVGPDVGLGPIRQREGAHGLARRQPQVEGAPQLGLLVAWVPDMTRRTAREDALLGARLLL